MNQQQREFRRVGVIGMGYVGLTLAATLAARDFEVYGVDTQESVCAALREGRAHIFEPGVDEVFKSRVGRNITIANELPSDGVDVAIISVSTPVDERTHEPYLGNIAVAAEQVARRCGPESLVVVRSTVPVGTSREVVLSRLLETWECAQVVMAPERTIQGQALRELVELPQVVGGVDERSQRRGVAFFDTFVRETVPVSSLETAELVKLTNNCHTDVIYSFGNEVAMVAERLGVDPLEVIRATNVNYPRPDIAKPGYVGGGCLSKDPYIMQAGVRRYGYTPPVLSAARAQNEALPVHVGNRVVELMNSVEATTLAVLGWAYKGWPPTDDMRGTPIAAMMPVFVTAGLRVLGHDPLVGSDVIGRYGGHPVELDHAFAEADAVLIITDHPEYRNLDIDNALSGSPVKVVYDSWRILDGVQVAAHGVRYAGLGYERWVDPGMVTTA